MSITITTLTNMFFFGYSPFRGNVPEGVIRRIFKMAFDRFFG